MPIYNADNPQKYEFSGSRIHRGLYRTSTGFEFNADVNGALNILRKSNVVSLRGLYTRGELAAPLRIRFSRANFSRTPLPLSAHAVRMVWRGQEEAQKAQ